MAGTRRSNKDLRLFGMEINHKVGIRSDSIEARCRLITRIYNIRQPTWPIVFIHRILFCFRNFSIYLLRSRYIDVLQRLDFVLNKFKGFLMEVTFLELQSKNIAGPDKLSGILGQSDVRRQGFYSRMAI
jgi:hypothetical protein